MIVCSCNVLSEKRVREACSAIDAPRTAGQVYRCLGCSPQCGRCARTIKLILDQARAVCPAACACCPAHANDEHASSLPHIAELSQPAEAAE